MSDNDEPSDIPIEFGLFTHLSQKLTKEEEAEAEKIVCSILNPYAASVEEKPLVFPKELTQDVRKIIHNVAQNLHLSHVSKGSKENRVIIVAKKKDFLNIDIGGSKKASGAFVDVPNPITEVFLEETTSTTIKLKWTIPDCNNKPITLYLVEVSSTGPLRMINTSLNEVLITELLPNTLYTIVIKAQNEEGLGYVERPFYFKTLRSEHDSGAAFSWGLMENNQLGFNSTLDEIPLVNFSVPKPTPIKSLGTSLIQMESHNSGTGLLADGTVFRFGITYIYNNENKEEAKLGYVFGGDNDNLEEVKSEPYQIQFPTKPPSQKVFISQVSCGEMFGLALSTAGEVFSWGTNGFGELGIGTAIELLYSMNPMLVKFPLKTFVTQVACGINHSIALSLDHNVFVWGKKQAYYHKNYEEDILLDNSVFIKQAEPRQLKKTDIEGEAASVYAGGESCAILNSLGELMTFGDNDMGQLGIGIKLSGCLHVPKKLEMFQSKAGMRVMSLSIGFAHMLAIVEDSTKETSVYSWGLNKKGQCGLASEGKIIGVPTKLEGTRKILYINM